jgi:hypothetical protein
MSSRERKSRISLLNYAWFSVEIKFFMLGSHRGALIVGDQGVADPTEFLLLNALTQNKIDGILKTRTRPKALNIKTYKMATPLLSSTEQPLAHFSCTIAQES